MIPINPEAIGDPNQTPVVYIGDAGEVLGIPERRETMSYPTDQLEVVGDRLAALSTWIDEAEENRARVSEARTWGRLAKIAEEAGEVIAAYIGVTGQNPRKGYTHSFDDVRKELLDVAVTALAAYEHMNGNADHSMHALADHVVRLNARAGVDA